jgi:hypothetical protein
MSDRYFVTAVRKSIGVYTDEGKYLDEAAAIVRDWQNLARIQIA